MSEQAEWGRADGVQNVWCGDGQGMASAWVAVAGRAGSVIVHGCCEGDVGQGKVCVIRFLGEAAADGQWLQP